MHLNQFERGTKHLSEFLCHRKNKNTRLLYISPYFQKPAKKGLRD